MNENLKLRNSCKSLPTLLFHQCRTRKSSTGLYTISLNTRCIPLRSKRVSEVSSPSLSISSQVQSPNSYPPRIVLRVDSQDALALSTQLQLFIALERYPQALQSEQTTSLDKAYCLYKSGRANDAKAFSEQQDELDFEEDRGAKVVLAQVVSLSPTIVSLVIADPRSNTLQDYRLGNYEASRDAFDDLASTAETVRNPLHRLALSIVCTEL